VDDEAGYASPVMKSEWLLCWLRNQLVVCEAESGIIMTQQHHRSDMDASVNSATPVWCGPDAFFTSACYGVGGTLWKMTVTRQNKGPQVALKQIWSGEGSLDCHYSTPVFHQDCLYGFHGRQEQGQTLRCIKAADGKVQWESPRVPAAPCSASKTPWSWSPRAANSGLWKPLPKIQPPLQRPDSRAGHRSYPALANGILYARDARELVAVDLRANVNGRQPGPPQLTALCPVS